MDRNHKVVSLVRYDNTSNALAKAISLIDGLADVKTDSKILIKPNLVFGGRGKMPRYGFVGTSVVIGDLLAMLVERGCKDISIGEGTIINEEVGSNTPQGFAFSGMDRMAEKYGARMIDFNEGPYRKVELDGVSVEIAQAALNADVLINVPVLKTHGQTKVSLGMKNLKGALAMKSKKAFHKNGLENLIAELNRLLRPSLTIIDGIYAMERGPTMAGRAYRTDIIVAGKDPFSTDVVGAKLLGFDAEEIDYLRIYAERNGKSTDVEAIDIKGENIDDFVHPLQWKQSPEDIFSDHDIHGLKVENPGQRFCSGCIISLQSAAFAFGKKYRGAWLDNVELCCGMDVNPSDQAETAMFIGNCAIKANKGFEGGFKVAGCPPTIREVVCALSEHAVSRKVQEKLERARALQDFFVLLGICDKPMGKSSVYREPDFDPGHF